jgi:DNA-binding FrmR family transcriptional regulator
MIYNLIGGEKMKDCCKKTIRSDEERKQLMSRINRIEGQVNGIKKMIDNDNYCNDVLIQIVAAEKSLKSLANLMFENHIYRCISEDIKNDEVIDELTSLFKRFND